MKSKEIIDGNKISTGKIDAAHFIGKDVAPTCMFFYNANNEEIGKLYLEKPMKFEGDVEESAKMFFNHLISLSEE